MSLKLKVCGMREVDNIRALGGLSPDFMGLIFYDKSPRDASEYEVDQSLNPKIPRVGVFVNPTIEEVLEKAKQYNLQYVQLHGDEPVSFAQEVKEAGLGVMKVFRLDHHLPVFAIKPFVGTVDYFLFDTKSKLFGGSGKKFEWNLLKDYDFNVPYFLSGGIELEDIELIKKMELPGLFAIDINSRFEIIPGQKDIEKIKKVKELL